MKMQDQENIKNQEEQENQPKEDNGAMTKLQDVFNLAHDQAHPDKIDAVIAPILGCPEPICGY